MDKKLAKNWRGAIREIDLDAFQRKLQEDFADLPRITSLSDASSFVLDLLDTFKYQRDLLTWLLEEFSIGELDRQRIRVRWDNCGYKKIRDFSQYAYHCFKANLYFRLV